MAAAPWNAVRDDSHSMWSTDDFNQLVDATVERFGSASNVADGDPALVAGRWAELQNDIYDNCEFYVAVQEYDGAAYAGEATPFVTTDFDWLKANVPSMNGQDFERRWYKSVTTLAAATYRYSGNAFANGDFARDDQNGRIYERVAGAWVLRDDLTEADIVIGYGPCQVGDICGPWLYNQIRDCLNELVWRGFQNDPTVARQRTTPVVGTYPSYAAAAAALATAWAAAATGGPTAGAAFFPYAYSEFSQGGGGFNALADRRAAKFRVNLDASTAGAECDVFAGSVKPLTGIATFDANGDPVAEDQWTKVATITSTGGGNQDTAEIGSVIQPNNAASPAMGTSTRLGYVVLDAAALIRYDVPGKLAYTKAT